jgi:CBS domain-containing protein
MLKVKDIMTKEVISVSPETEITDAAKILLEKRINGMPVVDPFGRLIGIICQSDLVAQQKSIPVPSVFTFLESYLPLTSIKRIDNIEHVAKLMVDKKYHTLPVVEGGKVVGIVGKEDVLKTLLPNSQPKNGI